MKKKNLKKKIESIVLLLILLLTFASATTIDLNMLQENKEKHSFKNNEDWIEIHEKEILYPSSTGATFEHVNKTINSGYQINGGFLEENIKDDDNITDSTHYTNISTIPITYHLMFRYEFDFSSIIEERSDIKEFNITIKLADTTPGIDIKMQNREIGGWYTIGTTNSWDNQVFESTITVNAHQYFDENSIALIRFRDLDIVWDGVRELSDYQIAIDAIQFEFNLPDAPANLIADQEIEHIFLSWDIPGSHGLNILGYNVYRGEISGASKELIATAVNNYYNDSSAIVGTRYYYVVSANITLGEGENSTEVSGMARNQPFLEWISPIQGTRVIFSTGEANFTFFIDYAEIDDVELEINGINFGSVWNKTSIIISPYNITIDGPVTAVLNGYIEGILFINESRDFTFGKLTWEAVEILDEDTEFLGDQLYLILHDPNGDNSFSSFTEQTGLSFGVGSSVSVSTGFSISAGLNLFGAGIGASTKLQVKSTDKHDFRFEVTEKTELTSSLDNSNRDYIGPGYGDTYWGEAWTINWQLKGMHRTYFNGTTRYEEPTMDYGIIRSGEVLLGDHHAPAEWRALNPVHNGWANVTWGEGAGGNITVADGSSYSFTEEITSSNTRAFEFQMNLDTSISLNFPGVSLSFNFGLEVKTYMESEVSDVYTTSYTIHDDESPDLLSMQRGIDLTFGTPIFRSYPSICKTSNPLEHNTIDYIPPLIDFPNINFDSSLDGLAPCEDDSPIVTVNVFDEGEVQSALISFSLNDGANWDSIILSEQIANLGTWEGLIPSQDHGTIVLWYIKVWDYGGSHSNRTDPHGNPYQYTVINRAPTILITTPNGNEAFENTMRIEWSALDHDDDDDLTFSIAYNLADTGWRLIETGVSGSYYDWDISEIEFCDTVLIKVTVDDGFGGTAYDESDYVFTIGEPEPEPVTSKPSETNWTLPLTIASLSFVGAAFTIAIFIRRSRKVKEQ